MRLSTPDLATILTEPPSAQETPLAHAAATQEEAPSLSLTFLSPPQEPDEIGRLGPYRVLRILGQGGMGIVFEAEDPALARRVALKVMRPEGDRALAARRFLREARLTASVRSENIVTIHQVGEINGMPFLAMELLPGESLASWLQRGQRPMAAQLFDLAVQTARGLDVAHRAGLVHRDIKPANIWLEPASGRVKILDFGLARPTRDPTNLTQAGMVLGTPAYMAPEQAEGKEVDARSDLFSLGCVLYEYATGIAPFAGSSPFAILKAMALHDPKTPSKINPAIPTALGALILRLMNKKPADRPESAAAVLKTLEEIGAPLGLRPDSGPPPAAPMPRRPISKRLIAGLAGLALCLLLAVFLVLRFGPRFSGGGAETASDKKTPTVQGVSDDEVLFGISAPFAGPASGLGRGMQAGIQTWFNSVNDEGGIEGRKLRLVALDDGYEPAQALANMKELFEERKVFAVIGNVGTPTAEKTLPYALDKKILFFGAFTGTHLLRKTPPDRYVFNYRASLEEETIAAVRYLIDTKRIRPEQIAVFDQRDSYGDSGFRGVVRALRKHGRTAEQILRVRYPRNTLQVDEAARTIIEHKEIKAVVMVPTAKSAARFIQKVKEARKDLLFTCTAFVNSVALGEEFRLLGATWGEGVIVTLVTPPFRSRASMVLKYRERLRRYFPNEHPGPVSMEGYIAAALLTEGLRRAGGDLNTETLIDALESIRDLDLGLGVPLRFGPSEHQASHKVWAVALDKDGQPQPLEDWD
jgi:serine/threonine protein kinase